MITTVQREARDITVGTRIDFQGRLRRKGLVQAVRNDSTGRTRITYVADDRRTYAFTVASYARITVL